MPKDTWEEHKKRIRTLLGKTSPSLGKDGRPEVIRKLLEMAQKKR